MTTDTTKSRSTTVLAEVETANHLVQYFGESPSLTPSGFAELGNVDFCYDVLFSSFSCGVCFTYMPIDNEPDEDGLIACDVDVTAGGDCVGIPTVQECIAAAWEAHCKLNVAKRFRMTDG